MKAPWMWTIKVCVISGVFFMVLGGALEIFGLPSGMAYSVSIAFIFTALNRMLVAREEAEAAANRPDGSSGSPS